MSEQAAPAPAATTPTEAPKPANGAPPAAEAHAGGEKPPSAVAPPPPADGTEAPAWDGTITVDGKPHRLTPEEIATIRRDGSLVKKAQRAIWEAAEQRKQVEGLVGLLRSDPLKVLSRIYGSEDKAEEALMDYLGGRIKERTLPDAERAERERVRQLEAKARQAEEYERAEESRREQVAVARERKKLVATFTSALTAAGISADDMDGAVSTMAMAVQGLREQGVETEDAIEQAAAYVAKRHQSSRASAYAIDDPEKLFEALGEERAKKLARHVATRVTKAAPPPVRAPANGAPPRNGGRRSWDEIMTEVEERDAQGRWTRRT